MDSVGQCDGYTTTSAFYMQEADEEVVSRYFRVSKKAHLTYTCAAVNTNTALGIDMTGDSFTGASRKNHTVKPPRI